MQTVTQTKEASGTQKIQGFIANPQVYMNAERGTITHRLGAELRIEMPINLYKKILGLPFEKKAPMQMSEEAGVRRNVYGLVARPAIFLSKDGNYLIHSVLGIRVSKHVNYYKRILSSEVSQETLGTEAALPA